MIVNLSVSDIEKGVLTDLTGAEIGIEREIEIGIGIEIERKEEMERGEKEVRDTLLIERGRDQPLYTNQDILQARTIYPSIYTIIYYLCLPIH